MNWIDHAGRAVCGASFMGGTICSDTPGHTGGHSARCQTCGGDWINETCTCIEYCSDPDCGGVLDGDGCCEWGHEQDEQPVCEICAEPSSVRRGDVHARDDYHGDLLCDLCTEELSTCPDCGEAFDDPVNGCDSCYMKGRPVPQLQGPTEEELAETYRSLGAIPPTS